MGAFVYDRPPYRLKINTHGWWGFYRGDELLNSGLITDRYCHEDGVEPNTILPWVPEPVWWVNDDISEGYDWPGWQVAFDRLIAWAESGAPPKTEAPDGHGDS